MRESPSLRLQPTSLEALQGHIVHAAESGEALEVLGSGSKRYYGRSVAAARSLSTAGLRGVVDYQPNELLIIARPGTPLAEIEALLAEQRQMFAFEPPAWGSTATLGGVLACNLSGPRRIRAGAARDHLLGFQAVTGRGEVVRGGGRVVKNVTGYDLSKLICGSFGTLAVLNEVCVKVLPRPEAERTVVLTGLSDAEGLAVLRQIAGGSFDASGLAHLPGGLTLPEAIAGLTDGQSALTAVRVEGPRPAVQHLSERVSDALSQQTAFLEGADSATLWRAVRELELLPNAPGTRLWRFSVPPAGAEALLNDVRALCAEGEPPRFYFDWGGALMWALIPAKGPRGALLQAAARAGGHGQIVRDSDQGRSEKSPFAPLSPAQLRLNTNLKEAFDPRRVLNPGRCYAEI